MYYVVGVLKKKVTAQQAAYNLFWVFIWNALGCVSSCYVCLSETHTPSCASSNVSFPPSPSPSFPLNPHRPIPSSFSLSPSPLFLPLPSSLSPSHLSSLLRYRSNPTLRPDNPPDPLVLLHMQLPHSNLRRRPTASVCHSGRRGQGSHDVESCSDALDTGQHPNLHVDPDGHRG